MEKFSDLFKEISHGKARTDSELGLERMHALLTLLGRPERKFKSVHIAGTNGKGSTASITASVLRRAGYAVGLYTSPHIHTFTERIKINGIRISAEDLHRLSEFVWRTAEKMEELPTEFELLTALAFCYFAEQNVEVVVMEVGLGGRLDATNVVNPEITAITGIDYDHIEYLGERIHSIAREKAGIIKTKRPLVLGADITGEAEKVIRKKAATKRAPVIDGKNLSVTRIVSSLRGQEIQLKIKGRVFGQTRLPLLGEHQLSNAKTAFALLLELRRRGWQISKEAILRGISEVEWPGRLEYIPGRPDVLLDGAHNLQAAKAWRRAVNELFHGKNTVLVIGILDDKDREGMLAEFLQVAEKVIITRPDNPRSVDWLKQVEIAAKHFPQENIITIENPLEAFIKAEEEAGPAGLVAVVGSLYLLGSCREHVLQRNKCKAK